MSRIGATPDTTLIFYGDKNNWWATYAFWVFQLFGHHKAKIMGGGRLKWISFRRSLASLSLTTPTLFSSIIWIAIPLSKTVWRRSWKPRFQAHLQNRLRLYRQTSYSRYSAEISLWVRGKGCDGHGRGDTFNGESNYRRIRETGLEASTARTSPANSKPAWALWVKPICLQYRPRTAA